MWVGESTVVGEGKAEGSLRAPNTLALALHKEQLLSYPSSVSEEHFVGLSISVCRHYRGGTQPTWLGGSLFPQGYSTCMTAESLFLWGFSPYMTRVIAPTGVLDLHGWSHCSYEGFHPAWPGSLLLQWCSICMAEVIVPMRVFTLHDQGHCSYRGARAAWLKSLFLWGFSPCMTRVIAPTGVLDLHGWSHCSYEGFHPAWPGSLLLQGCSICMAEVIVPTGVIILHDWDHYSCGVLNLHDWGGSLFPQGYSTCMTWDNVIARMV
jgi:hypothetical protein